MRVTRALLVLWLGWLTGCASSRAELSRYAPGSACEGCHRRVFVQYRFSAHYAAFEDPLFQAQLYGHLAPAAKEDPRLQREANSCLSCHSPVTWLQGGKTLVQKESARRELTGVTCDFCHTVKGVAPGAPGNANYLVQPGDLKFGSLPGQSDYHHAYLALQAKSEFCGVCHSARNTLGVETIATYGEWRASDFARRGVQCQDCHMKARGLLVGGKGGSVADAGEEGEAGEPAPAPVRDPANVFSHRFPGAHSASQLSGALDLTVRERHERLVPGQKVTIEVQVNNARAGHKMPTGSTALRLLWLEVRVGLSDETVTELVPARPKDPAQPWDVARASPADTQVLGDDVPAGSRLYRAVYADAAGAQTQETYLAAKAIFDSRLGPGEARVEQFEYTVPAEAKEGAYLHVEAALKYLSAPSAYYERFNLPPREPAVVAADMGRIGIPEDEGELRRPVALP